MQNNLWVSIFIYLFHYKNTNAICYETIKDFLKYIYLTIPKLENDCSLYETIIKNIELFDIGSDNTILCYLTHKEMKKYIKEHPLEEDVKASIIKYCIEEEEKEIEKNSNKKSLEKPYIFSRKRKYSSTNSFIK